MKSRLRFFIVFYFVQLVLAGCAMKSTASNNDIEEKFQALFPDVGMNDSLQLNVISDEATLRPDSEIRLSINNKSNHFIDFALDSYVRLFVFSDSEWVEVDNQITYSGLLQIFPEGTPLKDSRTTRVQPIIDQTIMSKDEKEILLRILILGEIIEDETRTGEKVGAYVDVFLRT
jgi:hypothetical protein